MNHRNTISFKMMTFTHLNLFHNSSVTLFPNLIYNKLSNNYKTNDNYNQKKKEIIKEIEKQKMMLLLILIIMVMIVLLLMMMTLMNPIIQTRRSKSCHSVDGDF